MHEIVVCDSGDLDLILWEIPFTPAQTISVAPVLKVTML